MREPRSIPTYAPPNKRRRMPEPRVKFTPPAGAAAKAPDPAIMTLIGQVDAVRLSTAVKALALFPTRHSLSTHNVDTANWLKNQFQTLGYTDVTLHDFTIEGHTRHNVVCTKPGTTDPTKYILIGAHFDSRMSDLGNSTAAAPGSDDNGSGTAALLELARVLKTVNMGHSIRFVAFSGEEQGLVGSTAYAALIHTLGLDVRLMINLDMIGHPEDPAHPKIVIERDMGNDVPGNDAASQANAARMAELAVTYTSLSTELGPIYDSDYMPFEHYGYVCVGVFDAADRESFYHSTTDTPDKVHSGFHAEVVRMALAMIVTTASH